MNESQFNLFTQKIIDRLPYWMAIRRKNQDSIGSMFLDVFGIELKEIYDVLTYAYEQVYIDSVDLDQINILYKALLEEYTDIELIDEIYTDDGPLKRTKDINELIESDKFYFIDEKRKIVYFNKDYSKNAKYKYGYVYVRYKNTINKLILELHQVWNFLDEFGFLLDCSRLLGESNYDYKNRLVDVFKSPPSSSMNGLLNAISRETGLRVFKTWEDGSKDFIIDDPMVVINKIKVDNQYFDIKDIDILNNKIILKGNEKFKDISRKVVYDSGIEMHQLHNRNDKKLQYELFEADGFATDLLKEYAKKLKMIAPIEWGSFIWDESFYDLSESDISGEGFIPSFYDSSIEGFKKYK